ncbi:hypothetical protein [Paenibacillus sp. NPDC057934]|uniref:hypothetical protein n=1 Tax=Paenibacillus sp. NPDC057934 TaxID=3346282 RepID=UPI0036DD0711
MKKVFISLVIIASLLSPQTVTVDAATSQKTVEKTEAQKLDSIRYLQKQIAELKKQVDRIDSENKRLQKSSKEYQDNLRKKITLTKKQIYYYEEMDKYLN